MSEVERYKFYNLVFKYCKLSCFSVKHSSYNEINFNIPLRKSSKRTLYVSKELVQNFVFRCYCTKKKNYRNSQI